jgi:tetratricopeptide (TPR) repeat protein
MEERGVDHGCRLVIGATPAVHSQVDFADDHGLHVRRYLTLALLAAGLIAFGGALAWRFGGDAPPPRPHAVEESSGAGGYADPAECATCHDQIARTYSLTGMARSFSKIEVDRALADFTTRNRFEHAVSGRDYTMLQRDGRFFQRRQQSGFDGTPAEPLELEAHYVIGSGNHAQTFVHRAADGRLFQLPVSWYAAPAPRSGGPERESRDERGGFWAMSPGYDRPAHLDFRRSIPEDCMGCHNAYPRRGVRNDGNGPKFEEPLPEGIDCQRCHGPGQAHVDAVKRNDIEAGRRAIVNPARLDRDRQLETCMQCHLEPTSSPLPFQIRRYEHPAFSYTPGKPLGDFFVYFDHAPRTGHEDKFEIASSAYRLRQSACFQRSEMTCVTCHDPHDIPRGAPAVKHYVAVCESCHRAPHPGGAPRVAHVAQPATCLDCHMPKRRAEDAVHVVMTDHFIQRRRPSRDLLAPRSESTTAGDYRGEVEVYYPPRLPSTPENELYIALAQVQHGSNLQSGIPRLEQAIAKYSPARPEFYYELARAYSKAGNHEREIRWSEEALRRDARFAPALKQLAGAATTIGRLPQAAEALERAVAIHPKDADALADLGNVYLQLDRLEDAQRVLNSALTLDPASPRAHNTLGLTALKRGDMKAAETHFRGAIRHQPDLAEAQNNLGNVIAGRKAYAEAAYHFEQAIQSDPNYVEARRSYGLVLALAGADARAIEQLREAVRLAPKLAAAHTDLADVLAASGRIEEARREYETAVALDPADPSAREALETLRGAR